jgi:hypothetical protein
LQRAIPAAPIILANPSPNPSTARVPALREPGVDQPAVPTLLGQPGSWRPNKRAESNPSIAAPVHSGPPEMPAPIAAAAAPVVAQVKAPTPAPRGSANRVAAEAPPARRRSKALIVFVVVVLLAGIAGAYAAYAWS